MISASLFHNAPVMARANPRSEINPPKQIPEWVKVKTLPEWIADLQSSNQKVQRLAQLAISELGTNALPEFLKILDDKDRTVEGDDRRYNAAAALRFIGPEVKSATPAFAALLLDRKSVV